MPGDGWLDGFHGWLIQQGYAWAASSYSKNYYDVRAGVEDTNKLALNFNAITTAAGRTLANPVRRDTSQTRYAVTAVVDAKQARALVDQKQLVLLT